MPDSAAQSSAQRPSGPRLHGSAPALDNRSATCTQPFLHASANAQRPSAPAASASAPAASPFGELVVRDGRVLAQKRQSASESRLVVERLGWILGLQISRSPNGYVSAFACAYGTGPAARSAALAWIAAGRPMASHAPEGFLV